MTAKLPSYLGRLFRSPHKIRWGALLIASLCTPVVSLAGDAAFRISAPNKAQLAAADLAADGRMVVAWKNADAGQSRIQIVRNGREVGRLELQDGLVQGVRWTRDGEKLVASVSGENGPKTRLYRVGPMGQLIQQWSSHQVAETYDTLVVNQDGTAWMGVRVTKDAALLDVGPIGEGRANRTLKLDADEVGRSSDFLVEEYSYGFFLESRSEPLGIGILWGARLWIGTAGQALAEVEPPQGCLQVQMATSTDDGLWLQCYRGMDAKLSHSWSFFPIKGSKASQQPVTEEVFRAPYFLADGTVIDLFRREGRAEVYALKTAAGGLSHLGTIPVSREVRISFAGSALLEETNDANEHRVVPIRDQVAALRERAAGSKP